MGGLRVDESGFRVCTGTTGAEGVRDFWTTDVKTSGERSHTRLSSGGRRVERPRTKPPTSHWRSDQRDKGQEGWGRSEKVVGRTGRIASLVWGAGDECREAHVKV